MGADKAKLLLAAIISVRASAYLFSKILLGSMGPFTLMGIRFLLAFALLSCVFHQRFACMTKQVFLGGFATGLAFFATMACELCALQTADSSLVAFLENTAIVLVPLVGALLTRKAPSLRSLVAALVALVGVGCLTLGSSGLQLNFGAVLGMAAALCYTAAMLVTDRAARSGDVLLVGILQVGWIGALGTVFAFLFETPSLPVAGTSWFIIAVLAVVCTGFGFTLQPVAQKALPVNEVSLMCVISPGVAAVLGVIVLSEPLSAASVVGMALILASLVLNGAKPVSCQAGRRSESET